MRRTNADHEVKQLLRFANRCPAYGAKRFALHIMSLLRGDGRGLHSARATSVQQESWLANLGFAQWYLRIWLSGWCLVKIPFLGDRGVRPSVVPGLWRPAFPGVLRAIRFFSLNFGPFKSRNPSETASPSMLAIHPDGIVACHSLLLSAAPMKIPSSTSSFPQAWRGYTATAARMARGKGKSGGSRGLSSILVPPGKFIRSIMSWVFVRCPP